MRIARAAAAAAAVMTVALIVGPDTTAAQEKKGQPQEKRGGPRAESWGEVTDAAAYLKSSQADDPGRPDGAGGQGHYYCLVSMAKSLSAIGLDEVADGNGRAHGWRADITRASANRQRKDGSGGSDFQTWTEGDPVLDTAYAPIALAYPRPEAK